MKIARLLMTGILVVVLPAAAAVAGGASVGNGGDTVQCRPSQNQFSGYYSLDYLLTYQQSNQNSDILAVSSWEQSRDRILNDLRQKAPELARSFEDFSTKIENHDDYSQNRIWEEAPFGLVTINDQKILKKLPENCYDKGSPSIIQSVIRTAASDQTIYRYDYSIYSTLRKDLPLQFSFLMVHEWLWDISKNVDTIRRLNRILHSSSLDLLDADGVRKVLQNLDINPDFPTSGGTGAAWECRASYIHDNGVGILPLWSSGDSAENAFEHLHSQQPCHEVGTIQAENRANPTYYCKVLATPMLSCFSR